MADEIIYLPNHGYSESDVLFVSWLDANFFARSVATDSFKISVTDDDLNFTQTERTITDGYVRKVDTGTATTTITGLDHLEGKLVTVTANGQVVASATVSNGSITVNEDIFTYQVGLPYTMKIRTVRLAIPQPNGTIQTKIKRISKTIIRFIRSLNGKAGTEYGGTEYLKDINATFSTSSQDTDKDKRLSDGGFNEDAYTVIVSDEPLPFTVLSSVVSVEVE
jgi:hypothetical protein